MTLKMFVMFCALASLLISFFFTAAVDANAKESMQIKVYDPDLRMSDQQMLDLLKKANLTGHGYKKEITRKLVSEPEKERQVYEKSYLFFKPTNCSQVREIDQELRKLLPGLFGTELVTKINKEIKSNSMTTMKRCKVGLEVHFKEAEGCSDSNKNSRRRKKRGCNRCFFCWSSSAEK